MLYKMATFCSLDLTFKKWCGLLLPALCFIAQPALAADANPASDLQALLIPQWHLSPNQDTKKNPKQLPQAKNQNAIFKKLSSLIQKKELESVIFEGCEADSLKKPDLKFNGWTQKDVTAKNADKAQTHLAFRLLAKFPTLHAVCGDSLALIEKNQLALSDMRGLAGFKIRITSRQGPQQKAYIDAAIKTLKIPADSSTETVIEELSKEIKKQSDLFTATLKERNTVFVNNLLQQKGKTAVVIGLLHIEDLQKQLKDKSISTEVWKPEGLPTEGDK